MSEEEKIIDRINRSYDDNTQYVEASAKDWNCIVHSIRKLHEEIEEKTTILLAGAEKVKQLEKGNRSLMESRIKWKNRYYKEKAKNKKNNIQVVYGGRRFGTEGMVVKDYISKDKIKELKEKVEKEMISNPYDFSYMINELLEENKNEIKM